MMLQQLAAGNEPTSSAAERLAQRRCNHVDFAEHAKVFRGATSGGAKHSGCVRIIHDHDRVVVAGKLENLR